MLQTIPWNLVDIKVLGIETEHAGKVFEGTEKDISNYLQSVGFKETHKVWHDLFFMQRQDIDFDINLIYFDLK